jgi:hypothetical protein
MSKNKINTDTPAHQPGGGRTYGGCTAEELLACRDTGATNKISDALPDLLSAIRDLQSDLRSAWLRDALPYRNRVVELTTELQLANQAREKAEYEANTLVRAKRRLQEAVLAREARITELEAALRQILTEAGEGTRKGRAIDLLSRATVDHAKAALAHKTETS